MPNLIDHPETFPIAVYRIAFDDPVVGWALASGNGVSNMAAQNLADRTAYLKVHMDALEGAPAKLAIAANLADLDNVPTARNNLGLGSAATHPATDFQAPLGFVPVQQGGGAGQAANKIYIGWSGAGKLKAQVDATDLGNLAFESWVIGLGYAAGIINATTIGNTAQASADTARAAAIAAQGTANNAVTLANNAQATANYNNLSAGTRMPFAMPAAPLGWTQDTSDNANNRMLRVVATGGNGVGGNHSPVLNNVVPPHTHGFSTGTESAAHAHGIADPGHAHSFTVIAYNGGSTGSGALTGGVNETPNDGSFSGTTSANGTGVWTYGENTAHTHSGSTDNGSSQTNWTPRYIDLIICTKN